MSRLGIGSEIHFLSRRSTSSQEQLGFHAAKVCGCLRVTIWRLDLDGVEFPSGQAELR